MRMHRATKLLLTSLVFTFLHAVSSSVARADPIVITFTDPVQTLVAGSAGSFSGSLTNASSSPVTVSGSLLTYSIVGGDPGNSVQLIVDFSDAYLNLVSPLGSGPLTLAPGESTGVIPIFTFTLGPSFGGTSPATVNGIFIVSNGDVFNPANELGRASWTMTVLPNPNPEPAPVPEPMTALLLGTGLAGAAAQAHRKRRRRG